MEWKWSNGVKYERSLRSEKSKNQERQENNNKRKQIEIYNDENMNVDKFNKREETYNRMSERELVSRVALNPFFE